MIRISGLWKNKSKAGKTYLRGTMSAGVDLLIFPNDKKGNPKLPDFNLYISERAKQDTVKKHATNEKTEEEQFE